MKMIKPPTKKKSWVGQRWRCSNCGAEWEFEDTDLEPSTVSHRNESMWVCTCSLCGTTTYV